MSLAATSGWLLAALVATGAAEDAEPSAASLFGAADAPAAMQPEAIGFYSRGCVAGAVPLPADGPHWQAMRPSRNRHWGLPVLVDFLGDLARDAAALDGWPGLLVGDMAQARGGPMTGSHTSHQSGLDVDIWLTPMPDRRLDRAEREETSAVALAEAGPNEVHEDRWTDAHGRLLRRAALDARVERIFVAPGIKKRLCEWAAGDRAWLAKVRPYYGHNHHFHVRLSCPPNMRCRAQEPPPAGDGCGAPLAWWYSPEPYRPKDDAGGGATSLGLADLPAACAEVLSAP